MHLEGENIGFVCSLGVVIIFSIIGNGLVLYTIARLYIIQKAEIPFLILANLALADFLSAMTVMPYNLMTKVYPSVSNSSFICQVGGFLTYPFFIVSQASLLLFTIEKFTSIIFPLRFFNIITTKRICLLIFCTWIQACIFTLPILLLDWIEYGKTTGICGINWAREKLPFLIITAVICFGIPFILQVILHSIIFKATSKQLRKMSKLAIASSINRNLDEITAESVGNVHFDTGTEDIRISRIDITDEEAIQRFRAKEIRKENYKRLKKELKAARMICLVVIGFTICLIPYAVTRIMKALNHEISTTVYTVTGWMWYITAMWNPLIYLTFHKDLRHGLFKFVPWCRFFNITWKRRRTRSFASLCQRCSYNFNQN